MSIIYINKQRIKIFIKMKQYKKIEFQYYSNINKSQQGPQQNMPYNHYNNTKVSSGSLSKYNKSPYLQKFSQGFVLPKKGHHNNHPNNAHNNSRVKQDRPSEAQDNKQINKKDTIQLIFKKNQHQSYSSLNKQAHRSKSNLSMSSEQREKNTKFKLPKIDMQYIKTDKKQLNSKNMKQSSNNSLSATLQVTTKKKKLMPISHSYKTQIVFRTKAGTNGNQSKINQDIAIIQTALPHGVKLFCVCDGHGLNGHLVSAYIKQNLIKNLTASLKKHATDPLKIQQIFQESLARTNDGLLNSDINTELSGSTVIAVFIHKQYIYSFNIGDSRAIMVTQESTQKFKVVPLSQDQKPSREDQKQRIIKFGGRVEAQKNQRGQILGPLRVWMKDVQMPGLAMTRSFGDKAGIKAGTHGQPQLKTHKITQADKFIVIASDGVWQYLENQQIMNIVVPFYKKNDIDMAAQKILRISTEIWHKISYSRDDITVIIVSLNAPSSQKSYQSTNDTKNELKYTQIPE